MFELQESPRRIQAGWIWEQIAELDVTSLYDPFAGDARVASFLKRQGKQVLANDPIAAHYWWNKALVENAGDTLSPLRQEQLQQPHEGETTFAGFADWANRYFTDDEVRWLSRWYLNASSLDLTDTERALAHVATYWTMGYWLDYNQRYLQDKPLAPHEVFQSYLEQVNGWVYDNQMPNMAYCSDPYDLTAEMPTDALLLVAPPPDGWRAAPLRTRVWEGWTQGDAQAPLAIPQADLGPRLGQHLDDKNVYRQAVDSLLAKADSMPYWLVTYQEGAPFSRDEWVAILSMRRQVSHEAVREVRYPSAVGETVVREGLLVLEAP